MPLFDSLEGIFVRLTQRIDVLSPEPGLGALFAA